MNDVLMSEAKANGIYVLRLHRPDSLNALNEDVFEALHRALERAENDASIRALLITGEGPKAFCAGADIHRLAELDPISGQRFALEGQAAFRRLEILGKPSLAAVNGYTFGGGCELAMSASIRIASERAVFGQPEVKLGVIPGYGGTQRLSRLVGKGRAMDLCITGRSIDASTALAWGLVTEVVPAEKLLSRAEEILLGILSLAPLAIRGCLDVIDRGFDLPLPDALAFEAERFGLLCGSKDKNEGVSAFLAKRPAQFTGQ